MTTPPDPGLQPAFRSWRPEVQADETGNWLPNGLRFANKCEAEAQVYRLSMRWTAVTKTRATQSTDPVNAVWNPDKGVVFLPLPEVTEEG